MDIGLPKKVLEEVSESLLDFLATTFSLYVKTQNFHYNVTGMEFYSLHLLFEKHYEELAEGVDELAERARSLGAYVDASLTGYAKRSSIPDARKASSSKNMLQELVKGHEILAKMGHPLITRSQELHDDITSDLIIKRVGFHEKAAWMLRSHLVKK